MTRKTIIFAIICCIMSFCFYAYGDEAGQIYMIYPQDFEDAGYRFVKDSDNSAHIRNLSEEDIRKSMESGEGIWRDHITGETGDTIDAYFVFFKDGKACVAKDRDYVRGANGNAVNTMPGRFDYSMSAEFLMEDETYIVIGDNFMTEYYMTVAVTPSYDKVLPLYFIKEVDAEVNGDIVKGKVSSAFNCTSEERTDGYFAIEKDGEYIIETNVSSEAGKLDISFNDDGLSTVNALGTGEDTLYMYSPDKSEKYEMQAEITAEEAVKIDGAFIRILKGIIRIFIKG